MSEYGYIPEAPEQSWGSNKGIFTPNDIYNLDLAGKFSTVGSLEFIQSQTASTTSALNFTSLGDYNVHFMTLSNFQCDTATTRYAYGRLSNDGGSSWISGGSTYKRAFYRVNTSGTTGDIYSTTGTKMDSFFAIDSDYPSSQAVVYFYNLTDGSSYSFVSFHSVNSVSYWTYFGGFVVPTAEIHNAISIYADADNFLTGTATLYGIRDK